MKLCLDRIEGAFAVCLCEDEGQNNRPLDIRLSKNEWLRTLAVGTPFTAELGEDGVLRAVVLHEREAAEREADLRSRLNRLFERKNKR